MGRQYISRPAMPQVSMISQTAATSLSASCRPNPQYRVPVAEDDEGFAAIGLRHEHDAVRITIDADRPADGGRVPGGVAEGPIILVVIELDLVVRMLLLFLFFLLFLRRDRAWAESFLRWDATLREAAASREPWPPAKMDRAARAGRSAGFPSLGRPLM